MYTLLPLFNLTIALGSLALAVATVLLFVDYFVWRRRYFAQIVNKFSWLLVLGVTIASVLMSLMYSEYFGFIPCSLCWLQRIAIYPQALMSIVAFRQSDTMLFPLYGIWLSVFGFVVAVYQYVYQMLPAEARESIAPCLIDDFSADCAAKVIDQFGFVTFPLISAFTFAFLIMVYLYMRRN